MDSTDRGYGTLLSNNSFSGVVGMVYRKEIDIGLITFIISKERAMAGEFLMPILETV